MTRVAIVVPEYRTAEAPGGGVAAVADFLVSAFKASGWTVSIVSPLTSRHARESRRLLAPRTWLRGPIARTEQLGDLEVTYVGADWCEFEFMRYRDRPVLDRALDDIDVVVMVTGTPAMFGIARNLRIPKVAQVATVVSEERNLLINSSRGLNKLFRRINRGITARLDRSAVGIPDIVAVENNWMRNWCEVRGAKDVRLLLPGVDTDRFSPRAAKKSGYLLAVGRLDDPRKDLFTLVRSYSLAVEKYGIKQGLILAGRQSPPAAVLSELKELDLTTRVTIHSNPSPEDLTELYGGADAFVMSSSEEGLGIVMQEAMASGLPVVATATEGAKMVVGSSAAGILVEFGDGLISRMATAISTFANDTARRTAAREIARTRAVEHFSARDLGPRFVALAEAFAMRKVSR